MFDDIFKGTDFGDIKDKEEDKVIENANEKDIWHTGQKPDVWSVVQDEFWDLDDLDEDEDEYSKEETSSEKPTSGLFDDIF